MNQSYAQDLADLAVTQMARVAAVLQVSDPDAVSAINHWTDRRAKVGRPIRSAAAVLSLMTDDEIRADLRHSDPQTSTSSLCAHCRHTAGWIEDPNTGRPLARCQHHTSGAA